MRLEHLSGKDGRTSLNYAFRGRRGTDWQALKAQLADLCQPETMSVVFSRQGGI